MAPYTDAARRASRATGQMMRGGFVVLRSLLLAAHLCTAG